jgi:hypothetical protein
LGSHQNEPPGQIATIPAKFESLFAEYNGHRIKYVNTYIAWSSGSAAVPDTYPGSGYQDLINKGITPVITWEPMYLYYPLTDPIQPNLSKIVNGDFDNYLKAFADQVKSFSDTVIIRLMHEFDGNWYPWSIALNGQDPAKFVTAFRHVVDVFRNRGATKVKWMWCPNSDYVPYAHWNWMADAYPGDNYVDIVSTDVYNSHYPASLPWWRSFRWQTAETYYYFTRYFPSKPFYICEFACRERSASEPVTSQSKSMWLAAADRELQSNFRLVRALILFNEKKEQDWHINSTASAFSSFDENFWKDEYYFKGVPVSAPTISENEILIKQVNGELLYAGLQEISEVQLFDINGKQIAFQTGSAGKIMTANLVAGLYFIRIMKHSGIVSVKKIVVMN